MSPNSILMLSRTVLRYNGCFYLCQLTIFLRSSSWHFFVADTTCYGPSGQVFSRKGQFLWYLTYTISSFLLCYSEWNVTLYHCPTHLFCSFHYSFSAPHKLWRLSQLQQCPVSHVVSSVSCGYCYGCYAQSMGLLV